MCSVQRQTDGKDLKEANGRQELLHNVVRFNSASPEAAGYRRKEGTLSISRFLIISGSPQVVSRSAR